MLQFAAGHPESIVVALGHNNCARWVGTSNDAFFQEETSAVFQRHFRAAQRLVQTLYNIDHSNDKVGAVMRIFPIEQDCF